MWAKGGVCNAFARRDKNSERAPHWQRMQLVTFPSSPSFSHLKRFPDGSMASMAGWWRRRRKRARQTVRIFRQRIRFGRHFVTRRGGLQTNTKTQLHPNRAFVHARIPPMQANAHCSSSSFWTKGARCAKACNKKSLSSIVLRYPCRRLPTDTGENGTEEPLFGSPLQWAVHSGVQHRTLDATGAQCNTCTYILTSFRRTAVWKCVFNPSHSCTRTYVRG